MTSPSRRVRATLDHPVIDVDGHVIEFMPAVLPHLREALGPALFERYVGRTPIADILGADTAKRLAARTPQSAWWGTPAKNTTDLATAAIPALMYERLDDFGIDFTVLFTTKGFGSAGIADDDLRVGVCRGFNEYYADTYRPFQDRMTAAGIIPMHTPQEAIDELHHCKALGLKVVGFPEGVTRPIPRPDAGNPSPFLFPGQTHWFDSFGIDSTFDYDPVWATAADLGFAVMCHGGLGNMPSGSFTSVSNYTFNHIGSFAQRMHTLCKSLFMGGVTTRFPQLNVAFLECGVGWAVILLCDLIEHWEKRNRDQIQSLNPERIDWSKLAGYFASHGESLLAAAGLDAAGPDSTSLDAALRSLPGAGTPPDDIDEFRYLDGANDAKIAELFASNFYFGCEADDRTIAFAFASGNPFGARLRPVFSSDLSHWDVPRMNTVVAYAHGLVGEGVLTEDEFREFTFDNPARLLLDQNPEFFAGTAVAAATGELARS